MTRRLHQLAGVGAVALLAALFSLAPAAAPALAGECPQAPPAPAGFEASVYSDCAPGWEMTARSYPTFFSPTTPVEGQVSGMIALDVLNVGAEAAGCTEAQQLLEDASVEKKQIPAARCHGYQGVHNNPIVVTDTLPAGVRAVEAGSFQQPRLQPEFTHERWECAGNTPGGAVKGATVVTCKNKALAGKQGENLPILAGGGGNPTRTTSQGIFPNPEIGISVVVQPGAAQHETNYAQVAGGGAVDTASTESPVTISPAHPSFSVVGWDGWFSNSNGSTDTQAGSHPYLGTFSFDMANEPGGAGSQAAGGELRSVEIGLPPGVIGNPAAVPQCSRSQFNEEVCPADTQVGVATAYSANIPNVGFALFNLVPPAGVPSEFGFVLSQVHSLIDAGVRTGSDYGVTVRSENVPQKEIVHVVTTLWGDPGDPTHNIWRTGTDGGCTQLALEQFGGVCTGTEHVSRTPFFTLPTSCGAAQPFTIRATNWPQTATAEATFYSHDSNGVPTGYTGCEGPAFGPELALAPASANADTASGLTLDVKQPLAGFGDVSGISAAALKHASGSASGLVVNPGQAAGLQACPETVAATGIGTEGPAHCPPASSLGSVKIKSPLLEAAPEKELEGEVFLLQSNPPTLHLLVAASGDGQNLKLPAVARLNETTGKIEAIFGEERAVEAEDPFLRGHMALPQLPASEVKVTFAGGAKAAVDTAPHCGTYQTENVVFTPFTSPFGANLTASAAFGITAGPGGGACPSSPLPFAPTMTAGVNTPLAGGFSSFSTLLQRGDGQKRIEKLSVTTPGGVAALISSVPLCPEPQASLGTCPASSHVGHSVVTAGAGANPLVIPQPGEPESGVYLTGPYQGAPFGLSIVTPIIAGPFDLGTIVDRAKIEVDPNTAQVTVTTDPLPAIIKGVPTNLRSIEAVIDRPGFLFNPTSCKETAVTGTVTGEGLPGQPEPAVTVPLASRFQIAGCRGLRFTPKFTVSTPGRTSKANGAGLTAKLSYPTAAQGTQANITRVKVDLPKQLPSRLTTLQKACTSAQFELNPANCPAASKIGFAKVITPVLPVPLEGPAIFVSHGGEAFPSLTMVLQGYGVTVDLVGATFISKAGITSTTFKTVPDVPFNTFELKLPQGKFSALAANGNLCKSKLAMPTEFVAQNGLKINQTTRVAVTGCKKAKKTKKAKHRHRKRRTKK